MTAVKEEELPLVLPKTENIRPSGTGESPLANIDEWVNVVDPETGKKVVVKRTQCRNGLVALVLPTLHRSNNSEALVDPEK